LFKRNIDKHFGVIVVKNKKRVAIMKKLMLLVFCVLLVAYVFSQSVAINNNGASANSTAILDIQDNAKGILIPRMAYSERLAIINPAISLLVYQTNEVGEFTKGFYYYDGNAWRSLTASSSFNNAGKPTIVIADTISNTAAQQKIQQEFGYNTQRIIVNGCTNLTALDLSMVRELIDLKIEDCPLLNSIDLTNIRTIEGGDGFFISNCPQLATLNCFNLTKATSVPIANQGINFSSTGLQNINFPQLQRVSSITIALNNNLLRINVPLLNRTERFTIINNPLLDSLSFPSLVNASSFNVVGFDISSNSSLTSIVFPVLTIINDFNTWRMINNKLSTNTVNHLLSVLVNLSPSFSSKIIELGNQTPPASPSGQGIIDKQTLILRPNTVFTD
jgi:hypothetical protein